MRVLCFLLSLEELEGSCMLGEGVRVGMVRWASVCCGGAVCVCVCVCVYVCMLKNKQVHVFFLYTGQYYMYINEEKKLYIAT